MYAATVAGIGAINGPIFFTVLIAIRGKGEWIEYFWSLPVPLVWLGIITLIMLCVDSVLNAIQIRQRIKEKQWQLRKPPNS